MSRVIGRFDFASELDGGPVYKVSLFEVGALRVDWENDDDTGSMLLEHGLLEELVKLPAFRERFGIAEIERGRDMACESPDPGCECAGCLLAAEVGGRG